MLDYFKLRKAIYKLGLIAHNHLIETGTYVKLRSIRSAERICKHCNLNLIDNEFHFLSKSSLYEPQKAKLYIQIHPINSNFISL